MDRNASLLIAAAFTMIGFALGRVTAPHPHPADAGFLSETSGSGSMPGCGAMGEEVQVIMKTLDDGEFDGDTVFTIPGGQVMVVERDGEMEVEVEMDGVSDNVWVEKKSDSAAVVVRKRVVVTSD